jgi:hypothetical protein
MSRRELERLMRRDSRTMCVDQEGRPSIGVLFVQGQEAARPQAMQAVSRASNLTRRGYPLISCYFILSLRLQLRVGRREEDPWCRLDLLNVSLLLTKQGSLVFGRERVVVDLFGEGDYVDYANLPFYSSLFCFRWVVHEQSLAS